MTLTAAVTTLVAAVAMAATPAAPDPASRAEARDILREIVAIDSSNGKGGVPAVANALAERLRRG